METNNHAGRGAAGTGRWAFFGFALIAGYFLYTEHRAHLYGALPYVLLLLCPLMHYFHHGGHGRHSGPSHNDGAGKREH